MGPPPPPPPRRARAKVPVSPTSDPFDAAALRAAFLVADRLVVAGVCRRRLTGPDAPSVGGDRPTRSPSTRRRRRRGRVGCRCAILRKIAKKTIASVTAGVGRGGGGEAADVARLKNSGGGKSQRRKGQGRQGRKGGAAARPLETAPRLRRRRTDRPHASDRRPHSHAPPRSPKGRAGATRWARVARARSRVVVPQPPRRGPR